MRKFRLIIFLLLMIISVGILCSCSGEQGPVGPQGEQGPVGPQGPQGNPGQPGKDGTSLLNGNGAPYSGLGEIGDSYIDLESWDYYVKTNKGWTLEGNIKGEDDDSSCTNRNGTEGLEFTLSRDGKTYSVTGYSGTDKDVVVPAIHNNLPVTAIDEKAFYYYSYIESIYIEEGITSIGKSAFEQCIGMTEIVMPSTLVELGNNSLKGCISLVSITIPSYVLGLGSVVGTIKLDFYFDDYYKDVLKNVKEITINGGDKIYNYSLRGCDAIKKIYLSESVTTIGLHAFSYCSSLTSIVIPEGVTSIGSSAFAGCSSLTSIVIPNSVTSIGDGAFYNCSSLTSIVIPENVTSIGDDAFEGSSSLTIYCEASSKPSEWDSNWNYSDRPVYWAGQWEYDAKGNPVPLS